jgi:hypothetical protein
MSKREDFYIWLETPNADEPWKLVDDAIRRMAALTGHERDQSMYQKMKEMFA